MVPVGASHMTCGFAGVSEFDLVHRKYKGNFDMECDSLG